MKNQIEIKEKFWLLVSSANEAWERNDDPRAYESTYLEILNFVKLYPEFKSVFIELFIEIAADHQKGIWEIVAFCMRELKWKGVKDGLLDLKNKCKDHRSVAIYESTLNVYSEDWEDADIWSVYS